MADWLPVHLDLSARLVAENVGLAMLVLLALLASVQLFNDTVRAHHDVIAARLHQLEGPFRGGVARLEGLGGRAHPLAVFVVVAAAMALLVDPSASLSANTLAQVTGMAIALGVTVLVYDGLASRVLARGSGTTFRYRVYPIGMAVAVVCLLLSRVVGVAPGVVYGLVAGYVFSGSVDADRVGPAYARSSAAMFGLCALAFAAHARLAAQVAGGSAGFAVIAVDTATAVLCVGGLQTTLVQLLPMRFINGDKIATWNRAVWFGLMLGGLTLYVELVVRPTRGQQSWGSVWFTAALVAAAVAFWASFAIPHWRAERRHVEAAAADDPIGGEDVLIRG
jgi:hypothetical protein